VALRTVGVRLTAEVSNFTQRMRTAQQSVKDFHGSFKDQAASGALDSLADRAMVMGAGLAAGFGYAVKAAADFDKSMSGVSAATHASAKDLQALREAALQAGKDTAYSATEAAKGITELSKAGVSTRDVLSGGLKGALSLAAAGQIEVGEAAELAASALTQFKLSGDKVPHVADLMAAAAGKAQGTVGDLGYALQQSGLVAAQMGLSIEDATGTLAAFASAGLTGSDAGTSFKTALLMLQNPTQKTADMMEEMGINAYDAQGNFVGISKFAGVLQDKLKTLTAQQRQQTLAQIFGSDAVRAGTILYNEGAAGIQKWIDKTNDAGYASETAAKLTDNLHGDIEKLKGSLETLAIEAGSGANGGLRILVQGLNTLVDKFAALPDAVGSSLIVLTGVGGTLLIAAAAWVKFRRVVAETTEELGKTGPAGQKAADGINKATSMAGKAAIAFGALQVAGMLVSAAFGDDLKPKVDALTVGLERFKSSGEVSGEAARLLGGDMGKLDTALKDVADTGRWSSFARGLAGGIEGLTGMGDVMDDSLTKSKQRLDAVDQSLQQLVNGGNIQQAQEVFKVLSDRAKEQGVSVDELKKALPGYAAALETSAAAAKGAEAGVNGANGAMGDQVGAAGAATNAQEEFKTAAEASKAAIDGQRDALQQLSDKMRAETDPVFALMDATDKLKQAQDAQTKAVKENGRNSTEAKKATRDLTEAAIELQNRAGGVSDTFDGSLTPSMKATLKAAGLTESQIKDVTGQFVEAKKAADKYQGDYKANASAPGAPKAKKELDEAYTAANKFHGPYRADISVTGEGNAGNKLEKLLVYQQALKKGIPLSAAQSAFNKNAYAEGGWTGPGSKYQPAGIVHADEYVINKDSRQKIERDNPGLLDHMNSSGSVKGYASGGKVMPFKVNAGVARIPSKSEAASVVQIDLPSGGQTYKWIVATVKQAFPGIAAISTYRPGARTVTGNVSFHSKGQAVDFPPSKALAQWWNNRFGKYTNELITPYQQYNLWRGKPHRYTGSVWSTHNFAGGNAHNHIALSGSLGGPAGAGGSMPKGSLASWIAAALKATKTSSSWTSGLNTLIMRESGGNPRAQNNWDSNAKKGQASRGLMQTIPSTFSAYRLKSLPNNIFHPVANIAAGIRYIKDRYGSIFNVQQANPNMPPKGYSSGGLVGHIAMARGGTIREPIFGVGRSGRTYSFGELGPERVSPMGRYASGGKVTTMPVVPPLPSLVNVMPSGATGTPRGSKLDTQEAMISAKNAVDALTESLKINGRTWSMNSAKGRENRSALISGVKAAQAAAQAKYSETGSIKAANKVYADYIKALDASMKKMGINAKTRRELLKAYGEQPKYDTGTPKTPSNSGSRVKQVTDQMAVEESLNTAKQAFAWTAPTFNVKTEQGRAELQTLFGFISTAEALANSTYQHTKNKGAAMKIYNDYLAQLRVILAAKGLSKKRINDLMTAYGRITLQPLENRWGGLYEHAASGKLTDSRLAVGGPTQYAWAEGSTGGELFAPKYGNIAKTKANVRYAVQNWWGGQDPWGSRKSAPLVVNATIPISLGSEVITRQVRFEVDMAVGQIANATVYQTA
jgi:TP901 family phage tail tape measure protein